MFTLKPVTGKNFINRKSLIKDMLEELSDGESTTGFALYGNRRVGKTSLFRELQRRLKLKDGYVCIYFSLWELVPNTVEAFIKNFSKCIIEGFRPILPLKYKVSEMAKMPISVVRDMLREVKMGAKMSNEIEFFLTFKGLKETDYSSMLRRTFELPDKLAKISDLKCILLIDEFPSIIDLKNGKRVGKEILGLIRTVQEEHKRTAICISGSIRKTMESSALSSSSPFYRQFIVREVRPFEKKDVRELLHKNLAGTSTSITEDGIESIYEHTAGIPFYIQFLGRKLIRVGGKINGNIVERIMDEFLMEEGNAIFTEEFLTLSPKEKKIVISIAAGNHTPSEVSKNVEETVNTTSRFLIYLLEKGFIGKEEGVYTLSDPVFEKWVHRKFGELSI